MLCERCKKKKATTVYRENISGKVRVLRLCGECTDILEAAGELEELGAALSPFSSPFLRSENRAGSLPFFLSWHAGGEADAAGGQAPEEGKCPFCGINLREITETGKVGCSMCYRVFKNRLSGVIEAVHGKAVHTGRMSAEARRRKEQAERVASLKRQLKEAITCEEYERAAALRDEIRTTEHGTC